MKRRNPVTGGTTLSESTALHDVREDLTHATSTLARLETQARHGVHRNPRAHAAYGWMITRDWFMERREDSRQGWKGPRNIAPDVAERLHIREGWRFRMKDDDGIVYYEGLYIGPDDESMFGPLDDLGAPDVGCTSIEYWYGEGRHAVAARDAEGRSGWRVV